MSDAELPPFSGDDVVCPKCGHEGADTKYMQYGRCAHAVSGTIVTGSHPNERLHRECGRCDYAWDEAVAADSITRQWTRCEGREP